jgi:hypothetical protein
MLLVVFLLATQQLRDTISGVWKGVSSYNEKKSMPVHVCFVSETSILTIRHAPTIN